MIVKFYSMLRDKVGKSVELNIQTVDIKALIETLGIKDFIMQDGKLLVGTMILVNGKNIFHLDNLNTIVKNDDTVDFFPPAAGG